MYLPELYAEKDVPTLHEFMRRHSFATLITQHEGAPFASHLPVLVDAGPGQHGGLTGHLARENPQSQDFAAGADVLAIFHGSHGYVSGGWYASNPKAAPTWNYEVVHAWGRAHILGRDELVQSLHRLAAENEKGLGSSWELEITPRLREGALPAILGFRIMLYRIEGKFKLGQNRSVADRKDVIARLEQTDYGKGVARAMQRELKRNEK